METLIHNRFKDAPWYQGNQINNNHLKYITIGGAGGIGSWTTLFAARAGFDPIVYDFDKVEEHNIGGQLYGIANVTEYKVDALYNIVSMLASVHINAYNARIEDGFICNGIFISAFDNMKARKVAFEAWFYDWGTNSNAIFIDGRLEAEFFQIFCVRGGQDRDIKEYREIHLFDDSKIADAPCTMKQTSHVAGMIAGHIVGLLSNHVTNVVEGDEVRQIDFKSEFFSPANIWDSTYPVWKSASL